MNNNLLYYDLATGFLGSGYKMDKLSDSNLSNQGEIDVANSKIEGLLPSYNVYDFNSIGNKFSTTGLSRTNYNTNDFLKGANSRTKSALANIGSEIGTGTSIGASIGGGWGAIIGAIVGTLKGTGEAIGSNIIAKRKARQQARELNRTGEFANNMFFNNMNNAVYNTQRNLYNNALLNYMAYGGYLYPYGGEMNISNGANIVEEGGTHEENPNAGVPVSIAPDGAPNLVEEGEVIYNDYVFSNRIILPDEYKKEFKLSGKKYYTFAEVAEKLQDESSERPNDSISKRGLDEMMGRLQELQEEVKEEMAEEEKIEDDIEKKDAFDTLPLDEQSNIIDEGVTRMQEQAAAEEAMQDQAAQQQMETSQYGSAPSQEEAQLAQAMQQMSPEEKAMLQQEMANQMSQQQGAVQQEPPQPRLYALGDMLANWNSWLAKTRWNSYRPQINRDGDAITNALNEAVGGDGNSRVRSLLNKFNYYSDPSLSGTILSIPSSTKLNNPTPPPPNKDEKVLQETNTNRLLRSAPIFGSLSSMLRALREEPNTGGFDYVRDKIRQIPKVSYSPIGGRIAYVPINTNYISNQLANQQLGAMRGLANITRGITPSTITNGMLLNYQGQKALADALIATQKENADRLEKVMTFNRNTDAVNRTNLLAAEEKNQATDLGKVNLYNTLNTYQTDYLLNLKNARDKAISDFYNNIGKYGLDTLNSDIALELARSKVYGNGTERLENQIRKYGGSLHKNKLLRYT